MKKITKHFLILLSVTTASVAAVSYAFFNKNGLYKTKFLDKQKLIENSMNLNLDASYNQLNAYDNLLDFQNSADINIYYSRYGIQNFYNMIRMAMLAQTETHFIYSSDIVFQSKLNKEELQNFLINKKAFDPNKSQEENIRNYSRSKVIDVEKNLDGYDYKYEFERIIKQNPDKKINVWFNSEIIKEDISVITELLQYPNVVLNGLEDSNVIAFHLYNYWLPQAKSVLYDEQTKKWSNSSSSIYNRVSQYILPTDLATDYNIHRYNLFFSDNYHVDLLNKEGLLHIYPFFKSDPTLTIKDKLFATRDKNNKRLSTHWSKITGLDWKQDRDKVASNKALNNKPGLIVLGTAENNDFDFYATVVKLYSDQYNIYYKGHPGHNSTSDDIVKKISSHQEFSFYNYLTNKTEKYVLPENNIADILESQIPSEELTSDHAVEENGLYFEKWALADPSTSAAKGIFNKINTPQDFAVLFLKNESKIATDRINETVWNDYIQETLVNFVINNVQITKPQDTSNLEQWNANLAIIDPKGILSSVKIVEISNSENQFTFKLQVVLNQVNNQQYAETITIHKTFE
ncbi:hypothetical protein [Mycoplasma nasistruthionis]|uniref:Uncharacterized protein n=1 Tax=Mycoplasma nasistruthionis TaxID=353852 RepID=A0A5B7XVC8_9MOLU|nr:hypothetical protein [Mycoplasma nasistruthionis]QCZ36722.1 hypothetical protein FG904_01715 [Mycoplasma nasistruthionis]